MRSPDGTFWSSRLASPALATGWRLTSSTTSPRLHARACRGLVSLDLGDDAPVVPDGTRRRRAMSGVRSLSVSPNPALGVLGPRPRLERPALSASRGRVRSTVTFSVFSCLSRSTLIGTTDPGLGGRRPAGRDRPGSATGLPLNSTMTSPGFDAGLVRRSGASTLATSAPCRSLGPNSCSASAGTCGRPDADPAARHLARLAAAAAGREPC